MTAQDDLTARCDDMTHLHRAGDLRTSVQSSSVASMGCKRAQTSGALSHVLTYRPCKLAFSCLTGELPKELAGTLLRNGPGLLEIGGKPLTQPLDGDGMVGFQMQSLHS